MKLFSPISPAGHSGFGGDGAAPEPLTRRRYLLGLFVILASAYGHYLIKDFGFLSRFLIVYGIPVGAVSYIWGRPILRRSLRNSRAALKSGLSLFGVLAVIGTAAAAGIVNILSAFDPEAANLLHHPNPVLQVPPDLAWVMVGISFLVVGPAEEYLFRGFVYGGLLSLSRGRHWVFLAFLSSILFAAAHLYYALVYGLASLAAFAEIVFIGLALAGTYYLSGGNLLIPALLHGAFDAFGFMAVAVSPGVGLFLRFSMMAAGVLVAVTLLARKRSFRTPP